MNTKEYFVSGIDTDCGKTYITGLLAYHLKKSGRNVITSKLVQTGCKGISEDILSHRQMMEIDVLPEDESGATCPFVYSFPASPHFAAEIDKKPIDLQQIRKSTNELLSQYELCLAEGAGGLMVPITKNYFTINYVKEHQLPLILVASSKLGSINHTLLSLALCQKYEIELHTLIYNQIPGSDPSIAKDSFAYFKEYLSEHWPNTQILHSEELKKENLIELKF